MRTPPIAAAGRRRRRSEPPEEEEELEEEDGGRLSPTNAPQHAAYSRRKQSSASDGPPGTAAAGVANEAARATEDAGATEDAAATNTSAIEITARSATCAPVRRCRGVHHRRRGGGAETDERCVVARGRDRPPLFRPRSDDSVVPDASVGFVRPASSASPAEGGQTTTIAGGNDDDDGCGCGCDRAPPSRRPADANPIVAVAVVAAAPLVPPESATSVVIVAKNRVIDRTMVFLDVDLFLEYPN